MTLNVSGKKIEHVAVLLFLAFVASCTANRGNDNVDECANGAHNCDVRATCSDTAGSFVCDCNLGYFDGGGMTWGGMGTRGACRECDQAAVDARRCSFSNCVVCDRSTNGTIAAEGAEEKNDGEEGSSGGATTNRESELFDLVEDFGDDEDESSVVSFSATLTLSLGEFNTEEMHSKYEAAVQEAGSVALNQITVGDAQRYLQMRRRLLQTDGVIVPTRIDGVFSSRGVRNALKADLWTTLHGRGMTLKILHFHPSAATIPAPVEEASPGTSTDGAVLGAIVGAATVGGLIGGFALAHWCWWQLRFRFDKSQQALLPPSLRRAAPEPSAPDVPLRGLVLQELVTRIQGERGFDGGLGVARMERDGSASVQRGRHPTSMLPSSSHSQAGTGRHSGGFRTSSRDVFVGMPISPMGRGRPGEITLGNTVATSASATLTLQGGSVTPTRNIFGDGTSERDLFGSNGTSGRNLLGASLHSSPTSPHLTPLTPARRFQRGASDLLPLQRPLNLSDEVPAVVGQALQTAPPPPPSVTRLPAPVTRRGITFSSHVTNTSAHVVTAQVTLPEPAQG